MSDLNYVITEIDKNGNIVHKDIYLTKGVRTTAASNVLKDYIPQYSATTVEKLEAGDYKAKAKVNLDAWAHGASGENSDFGPTKNPWDETKVPGGSSSGSAAAVADGYVDVATGTDTGGSIRQPASLSGVTAIKPTYGAVSRYGIISMCSSTDSPGAFATDVDKLEKVFNIMQGKDEKDGTSQSILRETETQKFTKKNADKLTIGIPKEYFGEGLDAEVEKTVRAAIADLEKAGHTIREVSLPHTEHGIAVYYIVQSTEVASNLGRYDGIRYGNDRSTFGAEAKRRIMLGTYASSAGYADKFYLKAAKVRTLMIQDYTEAFKEVDVMIGPSSPTTAFDIGSKVR